MMILGDVYSLAVDMAIKADPRGPFGVKKFLERRKKTYYDIPKSKRDDIDLEDLNNPFNDSRILVGDTNLNVDNVLTGIDVGAAEILLADRLNQKGASIDLVISHHPVGGPLASLHEVMDVQADIMASYGVPINIAEGVLHDRISEIQRRINPRNHNQTVDTAKLLGLALMCLHTATDNLVYHFLDTLFTEKVKILETVGDVIDLLKTIPEYKEATKGKAGPIVYSGKRENRAGKVAPLEITGGTEGSNVVYEKLAIAGIGTIVGMHASEEHVKECTKYHINYVCAGHISSDSLGMNLFIDEVEKRGVKVIACSGFIRVKRTRAQEIEGERERKQQQQSV